MSGKDGGFILPEVIDPPRVCVQLFIPNDFNHRAAFWGALWTLTYWNSWQRDPDKKGAEAAAVWKDVWFRAVEANEDLEGCEIVPFDVRQNEENPCTLEKTEDDGVTWNAWADLRKCPPSLALIDGVPYYVDPDTGEYIPLPVPESPPTPAPRPIPPREGTPDDNRCIAAANAVNVLVSLHQDIFSRYFVGIVALAIAGGIAAYLTAVLSLGVGAFLIVGYAEALIGIAFGLTVSSFDEETQDTLRCILYCAATDDDGVVTFNFSAALDAVEAESGGLIWTAIAIYFGIIGENGLNQAGATTAIASADCSECDCDETWCYEWLGGSGFSPAWTLDYGTYNSGTDQIDGTETDPAPDNTNLVLAKIAFTGQVTSYSVTFDYQSANSGGGNAYQIGGGATYSADILDQVNPAPTFSSGEITLSWTGDAPSVGVWIALGTPSVGGEAFTHVKKIRLTGTGANPFGEDNCV